MTGTTTVATFVRGAFGSIGMALVSVLAREVTASHYAFSPERDEVRVDERVPSKVFPVGGTNGCQLTALGLNTGVPAGGRTVTVEPTPKEVGTFEINCVTYSVRGPRQTKASIDRGAAHLNAQ